MKQIDNKKLCFYCLGCMKLEDENFTGVMRCNYFVAGMADWQEKWRSNFNDKIR